MRDTIEDLKDRYRRDVQFHQMVDQLYHFMAQQKVQPYEVRDAAFIAELIYRERHITPIMMDVDNIRYRDILEKTS